MLTSAQPADSGQGSQKINSSGNIERRLKKYQNSDLAYGASISLRLSKGLESIRRLCDEIGLYADYLKKRSLTALWLLDAPSGPDCLLAITEISYQVSSKLQRAGSNNAIFGIELSRDVLDRDKLSLLKGLGINSLIVKLDGFSHRFPTLPVELMQSFSHVFFHLNPKILAEIGLPWLKDMVNLGPVGIVSTEPDDPSLLGKCNERLQSAGFTTLQRGPGFLPRRGHADCLLAYPKHGHASFSQDSMAPSHWLGIGLGAAGFIENFYVNTHSVDDYEKSISLTQLPIEQVF